MNHVSVKVWKRNNKLNSTSEEKAKSGEGEAGEEDARENDEDGAPEESAPGNDDVASFSAILHLNRLCIKAGEKPRQYGRRKYSSFIHSYSYI